MCGILLEIISTLSFQGLKQFLTLCSYLRQIYTDQPKSSQSQTSLQSPLTNQSVLNSDFLLPFIKARGPDHFSSLEFSLSTSNQGEEAKESLNARMGASVLSLRGQGVTIQPIETKNGVLIYNGELYSIRNCSECSYNPTQNDGAQLIKILDSIAAQSSQQKSFSKMQEFLFQKVQGEFALAYYSKIYCSFYICKDKIGRRSLLISSNHQLNRIQIGSVIPSGIAFEIPNGSLIKINSK